MKSCKFNFDPALKDVATMATIARVVENVGVGAYLGAAHLVGDLRVLTAAASILTIEARHQTVLNIFQGGSAIPQAFDIPLLPQEVLAIAGSFISGCDLGIKGAFPGPVPAFCFPRNSLPFSCCHQLTLHLLLPTPKPSPSGPSWNSARPLSMTAVP